MSAFNPVAALDMPRAAIDGRFQDCKGLVAPLDRGNGGRWLLVDSAFLAGMRRLDPMWATAQI